MNPDDIRKRIIIAMFSDDALLEQLVLKGGNALRLVHAMGGRSSLDVDFSIPGDFPDFDDTARRIEAALSDRFDSAGYVVFDFRFVRKPPGVEGKWGGYVAEFKLVDRARYEELRSDPGRLRLSAENASPLQHKTFTIQISKFEHCEPKQEAELDGFTVYVYTPEMIVIEKLRAICQQMDEYPYRLHRTSRGRDFYDIYITVEHYGIDLSLAANVELMDAIFAAKEVPVSLLRTLESYRERHRTEWPDVVASVAEALDEFDFYFGYVLKIARKLETAGVI